MSKDDKNDWFLNGITGMLSGFLAYYAFTHYEEFINSKSGLGKVKVFNLIMRSFDSFGGKWIVLFILISISFFFTYRSIKNFSRKK